MISIDGCSKPHVLGLFKNAQVQGAQKTEPRGVYRYTLNGAVCSATQQMSVFQQPPFPMIMRETIIYIRRQNQSKIVSLPPTDSS
jgi:adenylylsulfate kinase-like enzyme